MPETQLNSELHIPDEVPDFGDLLRTLRNNHGYTIAQVAKMVSLPSHTISGIERSEKDLPSENILRAWFMRLGCGKINTNKLAVMARAYRVKHWIMLNRKDSSNPDILRILDKYKNEKLSDYDKCLLKLVGRSE